MKDAAAASPVGEAAAASFIQFLNDPPEALAWYENCLRQSGYSAAPFYGTRRRKQVILMQTFSEPLPADLGALIHAPASADGTLDPSLLVPDAERLERWYGARLGRARRWALIVEPHRKIAEMIDYVLEFELGIQSVSVPRPRLIPMLFRRWVPDLVVAEIPFTEGAPSLRDLENLRSVLDVAHAQRVPIPVLLCTTYIEITPVLAQSAGFAGLIHKPFLPATLVNAVRTVLDNRLEGGQQRRHDLLS